MGDVARRGNYPVIPGVSWRQGMEILKQVAGAKRKWQNTSRKPNKRSKPQYNKKYVARGSSTVVKRGKSRPKKRVNKTLKGRITKLEKKFNQNLTKKVVYQMDTAQIACSLGKASASSVQGVNSTTIRAGIDSLEIGTGTTIDGQAVGENTQLPIRNIWSECQAMNTTDSACVVDIYACAPKNSTSVSPGSAFQGANDDSGFTAVAGNQFDLVSYPTLFDDFNRQWRVLNHEKFRLRAGDIGKLTATIKDFKWSDDYYDDHSNTFLEGTCIQWLVRVQGEPCFDSLGSSRGSTIASNLMVYTKGKFTIEYAGNVSGRIFEFQNNLDTAAFTGVGRQVGPNVVDLEN